MTGGYEFIEDLDLSEQELEELFDVEKQEIEHEGWWADAKDKVRCGLCNAAIGKVLKNP